MELRHGYLQSSQKSRLTALPALPRACPWHHRPEDCHGNHPRVPVRRGNGGNGSARGFQGAFLSGGGCGRLVAGVAGAGPAPVCWRIERESVGKRQPGGTPPRHGQATGDNQLRTPPTLEDDGGRSPITGRTIRDVTREKSGIPEEHLSTLLDPRSQVGC